MVRWMGFRLVTRLVLFTAGGCGYKDQGHRRNAIVKDRMIGDYPHLCAAKFGGLKPCDTDLWVITSRMSPAAPNRTPTTAIHRCLLLGAIIPKPTDIAAATVPT